MRNAERNQLDVIHLDLRTSLFWCQFRYMLCLLWTLEYLTVNPIPFRSHLQSTYIPRNGASVWAIFMAAQWLKKLRICRGISCSIYEENILAGLFFYFHEASMSWRAKKYERYGLIAIKCTAEDLWRPDRSSLVSVRECWKDRKLEQKGNPAHWLYVILKASRAFVSISQWPGAHPRQAGGLLRGKCF